MRTRAPVISRCSGANAGVNASAADHDADADPAAGAAGRVAPRGRCAPGLIPRLATPIVPADIAAVVVAAPTVVPAIVALHVPRATVTVAPSRFVTPTRQRGRCRPCKREGRQDANGAPAKNSQLQ